MSDFLWTNTFVTVPFRNRRTRLVRFVAAAETAACMRLPVSFINKQVIRRRTAIEWSR